MNGPALAVAFFSRFHCACCSLMGHGGNALWQRNKEKKSRRSARVSRRLWFDTAHVFFCLFRLSHRVTGLLPLALSHIHECNSSVTITYTSRIITPHTETATTKKKELKLNRTPTHPHAHTRTNSAVFYKVRLQPPPSPLVRSEAGKPREINPHAGFLPSRKTCLST